MHAAAQALYTTARMHAAQRGIYGRRPTRARKRRPLSAPALYATEGVHAARCIGACSAGAQLVQP